MTKVEGWGKQWDVIVNFMENVFDLFVESFKFQWTTLTNGLMMGLDKIKIGWYKFKEAVGLGDSGENNAMISQLNEDVEQRKQTIVDGARKVDELRKKTVAYLTWELSWKDEGEGKSIQDMIPEMPVAMAAPAGQTVDYEELMKRLNGSGKDKGKGNGGKTKEPKIDKEKDSRIDLNEMVANRKGTGSYSAIVSKLNPVRIASLSAKVAASAALPALIAASEVPQIPLPEFNAAKTEYVDPTDSHPIAVRIVDLSGSVLSKLPQPVLELGNKVMVSGEPQATVIPSLSEVAGPAKDAFHETGQNEKGIYMERFCDQIVIHIADANGKGYDQIGSELEKYLTELFDDYGA